MANASLSQTSVLTLYTQVLREFTHFYPSRAVPDLLIRAREDLSKRPGPKPAITKAWYYLLNGFRGGLIPVPLPALLKGISQRREALSGEVRNFARSLRQGISVKGPLPGMMAPLANDFLRGLYETFPEGRDEGYPAFALTARTWGKMAFQEQWKTESTEAGRDVGRFLREEFAMGRIGGLSLSVMKSSIHSRDIPAYLAVLGWLQGYIEYQRETTDEKLQLLYEKNVTSILYAALRSNDPLYVVKACSALPEMRAGLLAAEPMGDIIKSNIPTIVNRALHDAKLSYGNRVIEALPHMRERLQKGTERLLSSENPHGQFIGEVIRYYQPTILNRAVQRLQMNYGDIVLKRLPGVGKEIEIFIKLYQKRDHTRRIAAFLEGERRIILYTAIQTGQFQRCVVTFLKRRGMWPQVP